jgi:cell division protein FtsW (lipid II flippase)
MRANRRLPELALLIFPPVVLALGLAQLSLGHGQRPSLSSLTPAFVFGLLMLVLHLWLRVRLPSADQILLPVAAGLTALGLLTIERLDQDFGDRQLLWVFAGALVLMVATGWPTPLRLLRRYRYSVALVGLVLVFATLVFGHDPNGSGARLWLGFGALSFQPSELLKILLAAFFASYLEEYRELLVLTGPRIGPVRLPPLPYLLPLLAMFGLSQALLFWQRDLGAALLFFGIFLAMLYLASGRLLYVVAGLSAFCAGSLIAYRNFEHVRLRTEIWLDPWSRASTDGFQVVQALYALASGGILGAGLGRGSPGLIPAVETDFVIAAIGEELGLLGGIAVVLLYMLLVGRGFRVALHQTDGYRALLAAGLAAVVGIQAFVILAGTLRLMPLTGITLPLVSYGGSSLLGNFLLLGLLLRLSASETWEAHAG